MRLVVFGYGNTSRCDDGIGPLLLRRIEAARWPGVSCVEAYQLQLEHALDLAGQDMALFIDAGTGTPAPYDFREISPHPALGHTSHALAPEAVLAVLQRITGHAPPPAFVLCVRGERFDLSDDGLSPAGSAHLDDAWTGIQHLMERPDATHWRRVAMALRHPRSGGD